MKDFDDLYDEKISRKVLTYDVIKRIYLTEGHIIEDADMAWIRTDYFLNFIFEENIKINDNVLEKIKDLMKPSDTNYKIMMKIINQSLSS